MLPFECWQQESLPQLLLATASTRPEQPTTCAVSLQFGLATVVLAVIAPLGGALSFKQWGFISQLPERWQPWVKAAHRSIGRITLLLSFVTIQLILGHHSAYTVGSYRSCTARRVLKPANLLLTCRLHGCTAVLTLHPLLTITMVRDCRQQSCESHSANLHTQEEIGHVEPCMSEFCSYAAFKLPLPRPLSPARPLPEELALSCSAHSIMLKTGSTRHSNMHSWSRNSAVSS